LDPEILKINIHCVYPRRDGDIKGKKNKSFLVTVENFRGGKTARLVRQLGYGLDHLGLVPGKAKNISLL